MLLSFLTLNSVKKKKEVVCVVHLWALNFSARFESWNGAAKVQ